MPRHTSPSCFLAAIVTSSALLTIVVATGLRALPGLGMQANAPWMARTREPWRLRTSDHGVLLAHDASEPHLRLGGEIPDERRFVRVVYPGLTGPR